jgi:hypothetical protein
VEQKTESKSQRVGRRSGRGREIREVRRKEKGGRKEEENEDKRERGTEGEKREKSSAATVVFLCELFIFITAHSFLLIIPFDPFLFYQNHSYLSFPSISLWQPHGYSVPWSYLFLPIFHLTPL